MKSIDEICEWIRIEEMKYRFVENSGELVGQSIYAMAFAMSVTPRMMQDLYDEHKKSFESIEM